MIIKSFLGIRNTSPSRSIPDNALADAVDVDIDDVGIVSRRNGNAIAKSMAITSVYSTLDQVCYVVSGGNLYRLQDNLAEINLGPSTATYFTDAGKVLFTNDGLRVEGDVAASIKLATPSNPLSLSVIAGSLPAGRYSATYTFRNSKGLESGSAPIATIELAADGGIDFTPVTPPTGYSVTYYLTDANGEVYRDANGVQLHSARMLAGPFPGDAELLAWHDSMLFVSRSLPNGSTQLLFSKPYLPQLFDYTQDYIIVPGQIRGLASTAQAIVIGTDAAIYAWADGSLQTLAGYGVVAGRPFSRTVDGRVYIFSRRGVCVAFPLENLTEKKASFAPGQQCSTAIVEQNGIQQFVVLSDGSGTAYNKRA